MIFDWEESLHRAFSEAQSELLLPKIDTVT